jgi:hypothetical protein
MFLSVPVLMIGSHFPLSSLFNSNLIWNDRRFIEDYSLSVRMVQKKNVRYQFLQRTKYF